MRGQRTCPHCGFFDVAKNLVPACHRCGGVLFKAKVCMQCNWAGEPITEASRIAAKRNDDVIDTKRLRNLKEKLFRSGVKQRLRDYVQIWVKRYGPDYRYYEDELDYPIEVYEAIDLTMTKAESLKKRPDDFFMYFRTQAWQQFDSLISARLAQPDAKITDEEADELETYFWKLN